VRCPDSSPGRDALDAVHPAASSDTSLAEQCRALRAAPVTAVVLLRPDFLLAAGRVASDVYFEVSAVHVAIVDPPQASFWPRFFHGVHRGGIDDALAYMNAFDVVITSDALTHGLEVARSYTGWPFSDSLVDDAAAHLQRVAHAAASRAAATWGSHHAERAVYARATASAVDLISTQRSAARHSLPRAAVAACSQLPGPPLPAGLPPGTGVDSDGRVRAESSSRMQSPVVALCASIRDGAPFLSEWLHFHLAAGIARAYIHNDNSTDDTSSILDAWSSDTAARVVTQMAPIHGAPRFGIAQRTPAGGWSGQREILGRCLTHALLDGVRWLITLDLDEYLVPKLPHATIGAALETLQDAMCVTVRRHGEFPTALCHVTDYPSQLTPHFPLPN
jgi:Glycosyl transferase family 2